MTRFEEMYNALVENGLSVEEAAEIRDLMEIEGYSEAAAMDKVLDIH